MATVLFQSAKRFFSSAARTSSRLQARMSATRDPIKITPAAVARIQELLNMKNDSSSDSSGDDETTETAADGVRIGVKKGGCNGLEYTLNYAIPEVNDLSDDVVITVDRTGLSLGDSSSSSDSSASPSSAASVSSTAEGASGEGSSLESAMTADSPSSSKIRVIVENRALFYLIGTTVDFQEDDLRAGFVFDNPNVTSKCGCEQSFSV